MSGAAARVQARVEATGLLSRARPVLVLLSGGRDSVCLLDLALRLAGPVRALHVDYGLRPSSAADAEHCRALCERLGVPLAVHRPQDRPRGNVQAWARAVRYAQAETVADGDVAAGHTSADQVETVLYRLAASPGRRALLGMAARDGRLVRPLLGVGREETAAYCRERGLAWREDPSNASDAYARNRARNALLPALRALHPAAEGNVLRTLDVLRDEAAVLDEVVGAVLDGTGTADAAQLAALPRALARLALQRLADEAADGTAPAVGPRAEELLALGARGGSGSLDVGAGLRALAEYGRVRFERAAPRPTAPESAVLPLPGRVAWGGGVLTSQIGAHAVADGTLDLDALRAPLEVRARRPGDRMRPLGAPGSRSLQDVLTDRRVPRAARDRLPVVASGGEIAWIPGVATGEAFRVTHATRRRVRLAWRPPPHGAA